MYETDNLTPSDENYTEPGTKEVSADIRDIESAEISEHPENNSAESDVTETENNELIFGKFKSMEEARKSYQEAEHAITRVAQLEKELQQYQELSEQYEQDNLARNKGYSDRLDLALDYEIKQHELDNYALAARHILPPEQQLQALKLIEACRFNGSKTDLRRLKSLFSPEVTALAAEDAVLFKNARQSEYNALRQRDKELRYNHKLAQFHKQCSDWSNSPLKEKLLLGAMEASDGRIDLFKLKEFVDAIENEAVQKFKTTDAVQRQNAEIQSSLLEPDGMMVRNKKKKWLTREEYYNLTPAQEAEKYDLIVEQVLLEKQGLLPPQLTK